MTDQEIYSKLFRYAVSKHLLSYKDDYGKGSHAPTGEYNDLHEYDIVTIFI